MEHSDELKLLKPFQLIEPCETTKSFILAHFDRRALPLGNFNTTGKCVWCNGKLPDGRRRRWCSDDCTTSANLICYPQSPEAKIYRLIFKQDFACKICGTSHEDIIRSKIRRQWLEQQMWPKEYGDREHVSLYHIGYGTGDMWHTDHIVPIYQGGSGLNWENIQTVCKHCHINKTSDERPPGRRK